MKKIVFITNNFPPVIDGVGDYTFHLAKEFSNRGYNVHIICKENEKIAIANGAIQVWPVVKQWSSEGIKTAVSQVKQIQPDWVMLQYVPYGFNKYGTAVLLPSLLKAIKQASVRVLLTVHEPYIRFRWMPLKAFIVGQLQRWVLGSLCKQADIIISSIDRYRLFIGRYSSKEIHLIPIPSNIEPVIVKEQELQQLKHVIAQSGEKILVTFGIRDHHLLLTVLRTLLEKRKDIVLLVCGAVKNTEMYKGMEEHIHITGYLENNEVFKYLLCGDVFFIPDEIAAGNEGGTCNKSGSLAAAFAAGLPIVGIKGDMNNELLKSASGVYLEEANAQGITDRILQLIDKGKDHSNYEFWKRYLSVPVVVDEYEKLIK